MNNKNSFFQSFGWIILAILILCYLYQNKSSTLSTKSNKITSILNHIENNYVDSIDIDLLIESAINQTLIHLDPHSIYMSTEQVKASM